ncbi:MAG: hypothetical protein ACM3OF_13175 [Gemmatimonas sp.]
MNGKRDKSPDPKGVALMHVRASETAGTHLANWPPPRHDREAPAMLRVKHPETVETAKRTKPRGWRLTRAMFSEFADDNE